MPAVLPTKGNLMAVRRSRTLAQTGYELMDRKRNILVREMMELMDGAASLQSRIDTVFQEAYDALAKATIRLGVCDSIADAVTPDDTLEIRWRSVMGVELPRVSDHAPSPWPEYGFGGTGSALDDAYLKFHRVKDLIREMAELETSIYRLAQAIKKTQKRANALKNIVIPDFDRTITTITEALEEKEREEFVRLKVIKKRNVQTKS